VTEKRKKFDKSENSKSARIIGFKIRSFYLESYTVPANWHAEFGRAGNHKVY
jgi:hypothetical protein